MSYNSANRSERLLQNRRFTTDALALSQEAFTSVLDLNSTEIYTQQNFIPTASSAIPFSGSSQNGLIVSASVVQPGITPNLPILKYWYRKKMKPAGNGLQQVYYFTNSDPSSPNSPNDAVSSDQLIETDQQVDFISPKYIIPANSAFNTEANPPGYKVIVYKSTSATAAGITEAAATDNQYVFDYKTGVLSWVFGFAPTTTQYVYITAYQYVGEKLNTRLSNISSSIGNLSSSLNNSLNNISTYQITTGSISASLSLDPTKAFTVTSASVSLLNIDSDKKEVSVTNLYVSGNFTVQGTASFQNTENLLISDRFVLFASGATAAGDGGIVVQQDSQGFGQLFGYDSATIRWGFTSSFNPATASAFTPAVHVGMVQTGSGQTASSTPPIYGGADYGYGTIHIDSNNNGEIWIYA